MVASVHGRPMFLSLRPIFSASLGSTTKRASVLAQSPAPPQSSAIDAITCSTASALLAVYGVGFVILGIHDAKYGVVQFSPFRTRIGLVGLVFVALVGLVALAQDSGINYFNILKRVLIRELEHAPTGGPA